MDVHLCLYGDVNLNLVDGSAIWLASLAETLAIDEAVRLTVLLKAPLERELVVTSLRDRPNVELVTAPGAAGRLTPAQALDEVERRDRERRFDAVLLRGFALCRAAAERPRLSGRLWTYLTDIPQQPWRLDDGDLDTLTAIARSSQRVLCQTEELRAHLEALVPATVRRTALLPPMVPELFIRRPRPRTRPKRLFYAGKFAPLWGFLETVEAFTRLRSHLPDTELHVAGDKVHDPSNDPAFAPAVRAALRDTPGLVWHGAVSRAEVADLLADCDVALSARDPRMDDSLELSTKVLEYGAANVPPILNRNAMHERLLGADYPLFTDGLDGLEAVLRYALTDDAAWERAREAAHRVGLGHTFPRVHDRLRPLLRAARPQGEQPLRRRRVVVASHDLKFAGGILDVLRRSGVEVREDRWQGHDIHDADTSRELAGWADSVWADWCLGNAVWYGRHLDDDQRLVVRLHAQELRTPFPGRLDPQRVERMVCVAPFMAERFLATHAWPDDRVEVVPNALDTTPFDRPKLPGAGHTIGMIGAVPAAKRLDRAVDVLDRLLDDDPRWRLRVAGPAVWDSRWAWLRATERTAFLDLLDRIRGDRRLAAAVHFDGPVHDIPGWLAGIGVIASVSDHESFHLALAEGLASRALPLVIARDGVEELFKGVPVHADTAAAARWLTDLDAATRDEVAADGQRLVRDRYDLTTVGPRWVELLCR